jgi:hypothetical protein
VPTHAERRALRWSGRRARGLGGHDTGTRNRTKHITRPCANRAEWFLTARDTMDAGSWARLDTLGRGAECRHSLRQSRLILASIRPFQRSA